MSTKKTCYKTFMLWQYNKVRLGCLFLIKQKLLIKIHLPPFFKFSGRINNGKIPLNPTKNDPIAENNKGL